MPATRQIRRLIAAREASRGLLIAFEGPDGSGKTTQRKLLKRWLESQNQDVVSTRWASSPLVKPMLKVRKKIRTLSIEEYSLLHAVDFRHRLEASILPALWAGKTVLADRYLFTALARDAARGLDLDWLLHAYSPLLWPDLVIYFSMTPEDSRRRIASTRAPHFYEAGQDITGIDDPLASYGRFIDRVVTEYDNLSVVFQFVTVDAGDAVYRQHTRVRELVQKVKKRPWPAFSEEAVAEWLTKSPTPAA
jgi:dTMP kinase